MTGSDLHIRGVVLAGDWNWRRGPRLAALAALLFGRVHRFEHLGMECRVSWWRGRPYLTSIREAGR